MEHKAYYMRDNHTFISLPGRVDDAMDIIYAAFCEGYGSGMLFTKASWLEEAVHAHGDWEAFRHNAKNWLTTFQQKAAENEQTNVLSPE